MAEMILECFDEKYIAVFTGGREVNRMLLEERYNTIFFTGSPSLGKIVMEKAARHLTPLIPGPVRVMEGSSKPVMGGTVSMHSAISVRFYENRPGWISLSGMPPIIILGQNF